MNASKLLIAGAFAALAAVGAQAGETAGRADYAAQNVSSFHSTRAATEVRAEALKAPSNIALQTAGAGVATLVNSGIDRAAVRQATAVAVRSGQIPHGEASMM